MMKFVFLCVALCIFVLVEQAAAHKACTYDTIRLKKRAASEDKCREACANYEHHRKGRCFAYVYNPKSLYCTGYVFDTNSAYTSYEECGANAGVDWTLPDPGSASPSIESYSGCDIDYVDLGVAPTKEQCEAACVNLDPNNESNLYGGCIAWFWAPRYEECIGLLSSGDTYSKQICGVV